MSNIFNIKIFHNNLELLRSLTPLNKGKFAKLIGIANAYRKDFDALGFKMIRGITDNFQGVDKDWLLSQHPEGAQGITFTPRKTSKAIQYSTPNDFHADVAAVIHEVTDIMFSGHPGIITALKSNIREFKHAIETANELMECKALLGSMQSQIDALNEKVDRLTAPPIGAEDDAG